MTAYTIATKTDIQSSIGPVVIGVETTIVNHGAQTADYIPEVYLDLSPMISGDTVVVTEYIGVDGSNLRVFWQATFTDAQTNPVLRFHGKIIELNSLYRVTINQTVGTGRTYPYTEVLQIFST